MTKLVAQNDVVFKYTVTDQDGTAVNLTSATIKWSLSRGAGETADIEKSTTSGISITNAAGGIFEVTVTDTDTTGLSGIYYAEAVITDSSGKVYTVTNEDIDPNQVTFRAIQTEP